MQVLIHPGKVNGDLQANASKSAMQRACAAALLRRGETVIHNPGNSNDDLAALDIIQRLGALAGNREDGALVIRGTGGHIDAGHPDGGHIHCGESGLSIRMFTPIAALASHPVTITGEGSLTTRPMDFFTAILPALGVQVESHEGKVPLRVLGPLQPANITVDGSLSSQFLTGLLMAFAAANASDVAITVTDLKSKPYIDLTLKVMADFGLKIPHNENYQRFVFGQESAVARPGLNHYTVEGDWSGAAFLLVAGAVAGRVAVSSIYNTSRQADKKIIDALLDAGAEVEVSDSKVVVTRKSLEAFHFDATDCPDLFPPLVALAANCTGTTTIRGLRRLKHKESDRGVTLREEFDKLGVEVELNDDMMLVHGDGYIRPNNFTLNSHHDHRIAMAGAVAALNATFPLTIRNADAVNKSYPDFWRHLAALGVQVETGMAE